MPRGRCLFLLVAIGALLQQQVAKSETMSYADAVTKLSTDCGADISKYCKGLNLGGGRIADCLDQNQSKVSPVCKASVASVMQSIHQRELAQGAYADTCRGDIAMRCKGVKGDGYILACLIKGQKMVSNKCNQAITDAGWR